MHKWSYEHLGAGLPLLCSLPSQQGQSSCKTSPILIVHSLCPRSNPRVGHLSKDLRTSSGLVAPEAQTPCPCSLCHSAVLVLGLSLLQATHSLEGCSHCGLCHTQVWYQSNYFVRGVDFSNGIVILVQPLVQMQLYQYKRAFVQYTLSPFLFRNKLYKHKHLYSV